MSSSMSSSHLHTLTNGEQMHIVTDGEQMHAVANEQMLTVSRAVAITSRILAEIGR
jgi:hypothetical protein